jgi:hypothetical protein
MNAIVIEHVPIEQLPTEWQAQFKYIAGAHVTVRIEQELPANEAAKFTTDDPAFGIWRDREDMADVSAYVRRLRQPRYNRDGSRNEP